MARKRNKLVEWSILYRPQQCKKGLWRFACIEQRSRLGRDVEFRPVHQMGVGHPPFVSSLHHTLDQFSHVTVSEQYCILRGLVLLLLRSLIPFAPPRAGFPSGFTSSTGRNCTSLMRWGNRVTVTNLVTPISPIEA